MLIGLKSWASFGSALAVMEVAEVQRPFPRVDFSRFLRLPVILGIEALISGRMLHESCPLWFQVALWTFFAVPLFIPGEKISWK